MIEIGVPRETAIYINEKLFKNFKVDNSEDIIIEDTIRKSIRERFDELPYWIKIQLEFMI